MHQWFLKDEIWHAFNLDAPQALCGEVNIAYGVDPISQLVPAGGTAHDGCLAALEPEEPEEPEEQTDDEPKKAKRTKKTK